jgi:hypothetical protein
VIRQGSDNFSDVTGRCCDLSDETEVKSRGMPDGESKHDGMDR